VKLRLPRSVTSEDGDRTFEPVDVAPAIGSDALQERMQLALGAERHRPDKFGAKPRGEREHRGTPVARCATNGGSEATLEHTIQWSRVVAHTACDAKALALEMCRQRGERMLAFACAARSPGAHCGGDRSHDAGSGAHDRRAVLREQPSVVECGEPTFL